MAKAQTFENHARIVPVYHYGIFGLLAANLLWRIYGVATGMSIETVVELGVAVAVVLMAFYARVFALRAQDRVIRLEMKLRLAALAPDLAARFDDLTIDQLCALRFAGDAELPALTRTVLDEKLNDRKAIKRMVRDWTADLVRV